MHNRSIVKISVIIPAYNAERYIKQAVDSVLAQKGFQLEVIVINDGSRDGTASVLKQYRRNRAVRCIGSGDINKGPSYARNIGIRQATGEYIAFLDGDDYWGKNHLSSLYGAMQKNAVHGVVFGPHNLVDNDGNIATQKDFFPKPGFVHDIKQTIFQRNIISMSSVLIEKSKLKIFFDEDLRSAEDYDFWIRVSHSNVSFYFTSKGAAFYRKHEASLSRDSDLALISTERVLKKNEKLATGLAIEYMKNHRKSLIRDGLSLVRNGLEAHSLFLSIRQIRGLYRFEYITWAIALISPKFAKKLEGLA